MNYSDDDFIHHFREKFRDLLNQSELSIEELCLSMNMSRSQIHRKIKDLTGLSTSIYIRNLKLERAKDLLGESDKSISEIAYNCGIQSPQNMSKYFTRQYNISPSQYRSTQQKLKGEQVTDRTVQPENKTGIDDRKSIAILAFENASDDPKQSFLCAGIAEEIIYGLNKITDIKVAGRSSSFYYKSRSQNITKIGSELGVGYCLIGSLRINGDQLRLLVQLIDTSDGFLVWTERYERPIDKIFQIQEKIASTIVEKLKITLLPQEDTETLILRKTNNVEAYQLYLKAVHEFELREDLDLSIQYFLEAINLDEQFVHAYFGIVYCLIYKCIFKGHPPRDSLSKIEEYYEAAIMLNNNAPEVFVIKAWMYFYFYHDISRALSYLDRAIEIDPKLMDTYRIKAYFLAFSGRYQEAIPLAKKAYEIDPLNFNAWFSFADIFRRSRNYQRALELFEPLGLQYPTIHIASETRGISYWHSGDIGSARKLLRLPVEYPRFISLYSIGAYIFNFYHDAPNCLAELLDYVTELKKEKWVQPSILALICFHLNREEEALSYIKEAERDLDFGLKHIVSEPYWDGYREHPKVQEALRVVGML